MDEHCCDRPAQAEVAGDAGECRKSTDGNRALTHYGCGMVLGHWNKADLALVT